MTKWAVETTNLDTGQTARLMESPQEWTAELYRDRANETFALTGRRQEAKVIKL